MNRIYFQVKSLLAALGLMSRIPIGRVQIDVKHRASSPTWYPWVGLLLGVFLTTFVWIYPANWPALLSTALLLAIWISFTGALHLDGLADAADAWVGGMGDRDRTLKIMRDPTCGPMAVTALIVLLLLKFALLYSILSTPMFVVLLIIPLFARLYLLPMLATMSYARTAQFDGQNVQTSERLNEQTGMASDIASEFPSRSAWISFATAQLVSLAILSLLPGGWLLWGCLNLASLALFFALKSSFEKRISGYTGDLLGASIELQELLLLFICALFGLIQYV